MSKPQQETVVVNDVLAALGMRDDCKVWRQRAGTFWTRPEPGATPLTCVPDGSADISGILRGGRRLELECKHPRGGKHEEDQKRRAAMITAMGGVYAFVRSGEEAVRVVDDALYGSGTGRVVEEAQQVSGATALRVEEALADGRRGHGTAIAAATMETRTQ